MSASQPWLTPPPLRRGDRVRVIAPGGAFDRSRLPAGLELLEAAGLKAVYDDGLTARDRYFAGPESRRLAELRAALDDPDARAIWVARGGYGAAHLLPHIGLDEVRRANRWLIGFSDVTALHALWGRAHVASLHGANLINLSAWEPAHREELFKQCMAPQPATFNGARICGDAPVQGCLTGGNLTVLASLAGTGQLPSWRDALVLLEDVGEKPYRLDRCLRQLQQAGAWEGVRGVLVGQLTDCEDESADYSARDMVLNFLQTLGAPVLVDIPVGHETTSRAVRFGASAVLHPADATLTVG